jgi:uncharacterized DUF497 family protein
MVVRWNIDKNKLLKHQRNVCFEQIAVILEHDEALDVVNNPNQQKYPNQKMAIVEIDDYAYLAPFVEHEDNIFLKTIIPSRKATAKYLR